ncbi:MAG: AAA family ATPase [Byssovorax sp.]
MARHRRSTGIETLSVAGYKSIKDEQQLRIAPLTLLAGVNSAGKSSVMQPLLLLKQTLESSYTTGPLLLDGPHVKFRNSAELLTQFRSRASLRLPVTFEVGQARKRLRVCFVQDDTLHLSENTFTAFGREHHLRQGMSSTEVRQALRGNLGFLGRGALRLIPRRFLFEVARQNGEATGFPGFNSFSSEWATTAIQNILHLPGLRGNPERSYARTAVNGPYAGPFPPYTASVIADWEEKKSDKREQLAVDLVQLGLTWKVVAEAVSDTQVSLRVGRLGSPQQGGAHDLVSIADVGVGVSQALPLLVALHTAEPGHLVYVEEPEIHLHPRAQVALAAVLARATKRGVRIVAETHSPLLLLAVQTMVASGDMTADDVNLAWVERDEDGYTTLRQVTPEENGGFGDWPVDFADVELEAQQRFLEAATARAKVRRRGARA